MAVPNIDRFRNITLVGHGGCGKTSLAEALLFKAGATNRLGSVPEKSSILDFSDEEKEKQSTLDSAVCSISHGGLHVNIVDTTGTPAFCGTAIAALAAAECAGVVVSSSGCIQVHTPKMLRRVREYGTGLWLGANPTARAHEDARVGTTRHQ